LLGYGIEIGLEAPVDYEDVSSLIVYAPQPNLWSLRGRLSVYVQQEERERLQSEAPLTFARSR